MRVFTAFLRLVRWPNLVFIILTQCLFLYAVIKPRLLFELGSSFTDRNFILLVMASVLIAAAGYIINDYFDLNIDSVNKPQKLVIEKIIKRRWAIVLHIILSFAGIATGACIDWHARTYWLGFSNLLCVLLLFGYSVTLKKKLLIGNVLISVLTAWVILVVFFCYQGTFFSHDTDGHINVITRNNSFMRIAFLYGGFAFIISLVREVLKDMEDMEGDSKYGCKTMPIVWGIPASKVFVSVWIIVLVMVLAIVQFYVLRFGWWGSAVYCVLMIIGPLVWILRRLYDAQVPADFKRLSAAVKLVMLTGILSMLFFKIYS